MDLQDIRKEINAIDSDLQKLFLRRMELCRDVAAYKKAHGLPIIQADREQEVINRIRANAPEDMAEASAVLFTEIMDISKCLQSEELTREKDYSAPAVFDPDKAVVIACQGTSGAYAESACIKLFGENKPIRFMNYFKDVVGLVESGRADFGILPLENSTVGSVEETYNLMSSHDFYITSIVRVEITHCFAVRQDVDPEGVTRVFSKKEALAQCSSFLKAKNLSGVEYANTALAAEMVRDSTDPAIGCICSKRCAEMNGLKIVEEHAADVYPNFTRFICFSKNFCAPEDADTVSVAFRVPHTPAGLYRTLTKFAVNGLNLKKIANRTLAGKDFEALLFLDFEGSCNNRKVAAFIDDLQSSMSYFKFLGNFKEIY
ncbi:MAG: chorismate mutase [Oscillospiraceae bacterium]|nr:chorismate mutase [Oscillospiraceae bacterium]